MSYSRKSVTVPSQNVPVEGSKEYTEYIGHVLAAVLKAFPPGRPVPDHVSFVVSVGTKAAWSGQRVVVVPLT